MQTRIKKNSCDSRRVRQATQHFSCTSIKGVKKKSLFCYLPTGVLKDVCTCYLHVILSHKLHGLHFVQTVQWHTTEIYEQQLNVLLWSYVFFSPSLLLLRALIETVQSVATVKCALVSSKHGCRIEMNWLVSFGAEILKMNNKLCDSYKTIILYYHQCAIKILFTPVLQQVWHIT